MASAELEPATPNDWREFGKWRERFALEYAQTDNRSFEHTINPYMPPEVLKERFQNIGKTHKVFWITRGAKRIGFFTVLYIEFEDGNMWVIEDVYVLPKWRSKGIATRLRKELYQTGVGGSYVSTDRLSKLVEYYKSQGCRSAAYIPQHQLAIVSTREPDNEHWYKLKES